MKNKIKKTYDDDDENTKNSCNQLYNEQINVIVMYLFYYLFKLLLSHNHKRLQLELK